MDRLLEIAKNEEKARFEASKVKMQLIHGQSFAN